MNWLKRNWQWLTVSALAILVMSVLLTRGSTRISDRENTFDPALESGKWAVRLLLLSLSVTPLNNFFGWRSAIPFRKPLGLWAFGFAALHFLLLYTDTEYGGGYRWLVFPIQPFILFGLTGLLILSAMAITSNRWAMKRLGKRWKTLHRLVYVAGMAVVYHAILALDNSKRMLIRDPTVIHELHIYLVILTILLLVRLQPVRTPLKRLISPRMLTPSRVRQ